MAAALIVVGFTGIALATQETQYLVAEVILICLALAVGQARSGCRVRSARKPRSVRARSRPCQRPTLIALAASRALGTPHQERTKVDMQDDTASYVFQQ